MSGAWIAGVLWRLLSLMGSLLLTLWGLTAITFSIGRFIPTDPVLAIVGDHASRETYERTRLALGLDRSVLEQYLIYLRKILAGDFGTSVMSSHSVLSDLYQFFPATFELATIATVLGVLVGVPAGVLAAANRGRWPDRLVSIVGLFGYSMPIFWLGLIGLAIFYGRLSWVGGPGRLDTGFEDIVTARSGVILVDSALAG